MKVKRLEIQGFKSFKDKTVLHFDEGVTGIVGPNGCGKSNIVDSFFWVMGEQSIKHMRADGQIDLIFNGSEKYAALSMAEVTLVLSTGAKGESLPEGMSLRDLPAHLKYDEISVTRRLYRSGESEYFINGQLCRLKDIHELFMDTGAGPKAYSIIEQGQIAKIIQSKPEDRRVLVEEAAGIVKFKARKKESQRKIEATQQNLNRINDIVIEIERSLASLERQSQKARQYKTYKDELLGKEVLVGRKKLFGLKSMIDSSEGRLQDLATSEVESRNTLQTAELRVENLKIQLTEAQRTTEDEMLILQNLQREISQEDTKRQIHQRRIQEIENSNQTLEEEFHELKDSILRAQSEKLELDGEVQSLQEVFDSGDVVLKDFQTQLTEARSKMSELESVLEKEKRQLMSSFTQRHEMSNQVHSLEARLDSSSVQMNALAQKIAEREKELQEYRNTQAPLKEKCDALAYQMEFSSKKSAELKLECESLEQELKVLRAEEAQMRQELSRNESKFKALSDFVENNEALKTDVRNIIKDADFAGTAGSIFADHLEAHPGYEFALEAVLKDFLENLLIENSDKAKTLLHTLKEKNLGRASFWALDLLEQGSSRMAAVNLAQVSERLPQVRPLRDLVRINHANAHNIQALFEKFFVVDSIEDAIECFKKAADLGLSFVTREGDVVDRYGRISGGSTKSLESGLIACKAELQKLSDVIAKEQNSLLQKSEYLNSVETRFLEKESEQDATSAQLDKQEAEHSLAERELFMVESKLQSSSNELDRLNTENEILSNERQERLQKLDSIRVELSGLEGTAKELEGLIEGRSGESQAASEKVTSLQNEMNHFKVEFASTQERLRHAKQNSERVDYQLRQDESRHEEVERMMNRKMDEKDILIQELSGYEEALLSMNTRAQDLEDSLRTKKNDLEKINHQLTETFEDQRSAMKRLEEVSSELNRLKLDAERASLEYQMLYQSMFQKYGLEEARIAPQDEQDRMAFDELTPEKESELQSEVDNLHERIRKLGEVNVLAIEEYDVQKKRYDFLLVQRDDLNKSIADLEKAIERINETSKERFNIAFHEINKRFERIFPIVFGGGSGKLIMTNPEDLTETGVEILVEPPGKKVGSIQLMSGGEKALTAVALIFSIFLIKPSPFCVLDEVDAPLDDHNVGKFNALLKEMATRSQFIIITHNKRTMELNDKLYGVTMEEPGVSKMVSIQIQ